MTMPFELPPELSVGIDELCELAEKYLPDAALQLIKRAYTVAAQAHGDQKRKSGESYITHPLTVAYILAKLEMDTQALCAAILHDVLEDTDISKQSLMEMFGSSVAELVDGVTKITKIEDKSKEDMQAATFQKMFHASNRDIRVIIIKLADRLHNIRTLHHLDIVKQRRIARETIEIYAPIARRLGMYRMMVELQEQCFLILYPKRYKVLAHRIAQYNQERAELFQNFKEKLEYSFQAKHLPATIKAKPLHYYGIYNEMKYFKRNTHGHAKHTFERVMQKKCGFTILVASTEHCYLSLYAVHDAYRPQPNSFEDGIITPSANGAQALQTCILSEQGVQIFIQICTHEMYQQQQLGIVSSRSNYGLYGFDALSVNYSTAWMGNLLHLGETAENGQEFMENVKSALFRNEIRVLTPCGQVHTLPEGATALDFAYSIHTDIGDHCSFVRIAGDNKSPYTELQNGQIVQVFTADHAHPQESWLEHVVTSTARNRIRHYLRTRKAQDELHIGKDWLKRELEKHRISLENLSDDIKNALLHQLKLDNLDKLFKEIANGKRFAAITAHQIHSLLTEKEESAIASNNVQNAQDTALLNNNSTAANTPALAVKSSSSMLQGTEGITIRYAHCCYPIPEDEIMGFVTPGAGLVVHRATCRKALEYSHASDKWIPLAWESKASGEFLVMLRIEVHDQMGVLANITTLMATLQLNIRNLSTEPRPNKTNMLRFSIEVRNQRHLNEVMRHIRTIPEVIKVQRIVNRGKKGE